MEILKRDSLKLGGFAGLTEHQLITDRRLFRRRPAPGAWDGLGEFVYLADARFMPHGQTEMHPHLEIDVISVMAEGRIAHEGSLEHGQELNGKDVQVQRAGGEGFSHNEINPDDTENRMIQIWVRPEVAGEPAGYKHYVPEMGEVKRIYGGVEPTDDVYQAKTVIDVSLMTQGQEIHVAGDYLAYVVSGKAEANSQKVEEGDLLRGEGLKLKATEESHVILVHLNA